MPLREAPIAPGPEGPSVALQITQEVQHALRGVMRQRGYYSNMGDVELFDYRLGEDGKAAGNATKRPSVVLARDLSSRPAEMGCYHDYQLTVRIFVRFEPEAGRSTLETADSIELDVRRALLELPDWCGAVGAMGIDPIEDDPNALEFSVDFEFTTDRNLVLVGHP